jgi:hypothetical protein
MFPIDAYSIIRVAKLLYDMFLFKNGLKQGDALSPLLFNFVLEYAMRVQVNQDALKLNGTHQLLVCVLCYYVGGKRIYYKGNRRNFSRSSKETGLQVNADKTKYVYTCL